MTANACDRLRQRKAEILERWEGEVRSKIPLENWEARPVLRDALPRLLELLAEALEKNAKPTLTPEGESLAVKYGIERARMMHYSLEHLFMEYRALREVVFNALIESGALSESERATIRGFIDESIQHSAVSFTEVLASIRSQFVATLSHDLRGPLTAALANVEMILRQPEKKYRHAHFVFRAAENLKRIDKMISNLLDATRVQAGETLSFQMTEFDAVTWIRGFCDELVTVHGDRFRFYSPAKSLRVWWNSEGIARVLENLISNAVKYGDPHSPITITLRPQQDRVVLTVHNQGQPIPQDEQRLLFQAFKRTPSASQGRLPGWGLGLALVRGVAEGHGGRTVLESLPGRGTTLGVELPRDARIPSSRVTLRPTG
jgi:signal transduction histidine kinase